MGVTDWGWRMMCSTDNSQGNIPLDYGCSVGAHCPFGDIGWIFLETTNFDGHVFADGPVVWVDEGTTRKTFSEIFDLHPKQHMGGSIFSKPQQL